MAARHPATSTRDSRSPSDLERLETESRLHARRALDRSLAALDEGLALAVSDSDDDEETLPASLLGDYRPAEEVSALNSRAWTLVAISGFLLLMIAAGACGAAVVFRDRLAVILR